MVIASFPCEANSGTYSRKGARAQPSLRRWCDHRLYVLLLTVPYEPAVLLPPDEPAPRLPVS
jgi:hypothetical protein